MAGALRAGGEVVKRNLLWIVVDCARSEKTVIDLPGGDLRTRRSALLPFVDAMRTAGTTWTGLVSVSSTTTPNFGTMLTGLLPVHHGIQEHSRYSLLPDVGTLAEVLSAGGYHTRAEVTGPLIPETGLNRGFHVYRYRDRSSYLHRGFLDEVRALLPTLPEPWFLCLHLWEAHEPYQEPSPFDTEDHGLTSYDRALSFVDHALADLFLPLDLERTVVVYSSDHGERLPCDYERNRALGGDEMQVLEAWGRHWSDDRDLSFARVRAELGEVRARIYAHNVVGHGFHLTEDLVRIPLIVAGDRRLEPATIRPELRSQVDLFPTLLDLAGLPAALMEGRGSRSLLEPGSDALVYVEANGSGGKKHASRCYLRGSRSDRFKYWRMEAEGIDHRVLWDLASDPRETRNVAAAHPDVVAEMDRFVDARLAGRRSHLVDRKGAAARAVEERLRALGYL
jgi:arylsulfatase A-like enzyme